MYLCFKMMLRYILHISQIRPVCAYIYFFDEMLCLTSKFHPFSTASCLSGSWGEVSVNYQNKLNKPVPQKHHGYDMKKKKTAGKKICLKISLAFSCLTFAIFLGVSSIVENQDDGTCKIKSVTNIKFKSNHIYFPATLLNGPLY